MDVLTFWGASEDIREWYSNKLGEILGEIPQAYTVPGPAERKAFEAGIIRRLKNGPDPRPEMPLPKKTNNN